MGQSATYEETIYAFMEWMRLVIEDPEGFLHSWEAVDNFREDKRTYGQEQADYFFHLISTRK